MRHKLIASSDLAGDVAEIRANPGAVIEIRDDVLRDLMTCPYPIERYNESEHGATDHPRRRTCV